MRASIVRVLVVVSVVPVWGCGMAALEASVRDHGARLQTAERSQAELQRKLEDVDNKLFLVGDQLETQKLAMARARVEPRLPVVTLGPPGQQPGQLGSIGGTTEPERSPAALYGPATNGTAQNQPGAWIGEPGGRRPITLRGTSTPWLDDPPAWEPTPPSDAVAEPESLPPARPLPIGVASLGTPRSSRARADEPRATIVASAAHVATRPADPTALYQAAYARLKDNQVDEAAEEFRALVRRFPTHDLADNAQYWLAETRYARNAYAEAAEEFRTVVRRWPAGNKAPDALLKLGYCLLALGEPDKARSVLQEVSQQYPRTDASQLAARRLAELVEKNP